eukprot:scaffold327274_cov44-Prasinocladus_malaysianus.AAC.2
MSTAQASLAGRAAPVVLPTAIVRVRQSATIAVVSKPSLGAGRVSRGGVLVRAETQQQGGTSLAGEGQQQDKANEGIFGFFNKAKRALRQSVVPQ